ncbi:MAG: hypothetical protein K9N05_01165 [Candidatus Marinimicrobia bacterium]|nr:hypothetical protein [Candidatus Neomarinimicrobiota bacterium]
MKKINIILIAGLIIIFGCFKQNNEGYLEVVNHSTESISIGGFDQGYETIASGDTSKVYTFDLGEDPHRWFNVEVGGYYFTTLAQWYYNTPYWGYSEDVCIHNGNKTTLDIYNYLVASSLTITNLTSSPASYFLNFYRSDLSWYIDPEGLNRWNLNIPPDDSFHFSFRIYEPYVIDTTVMISGGEHLNVDVYPE